MELGEGEAQICRLCGQCESIYIDVFGEEGTKRFLGLKIHTRINILVKENDGLPQVVCIRCLGTLEFLCDFYERCHLTQKEFLKTSQNQNIINEKLLKNSTNDTESDKENDVPFVNETKWKAKVLSPDNLKKSKNYLSENNTLSRTENKEENNDHIDNNISIDNVHLITQTQLNNIISKNQSIMKNVISHENTSKNDQHSANNLKENILEKNINCITRSTNNLNTSQINETKVNINLDQPIRRKRGRKSKLEKIREVNLTTNYKKKIQNHLSDKKRDNVNNEYKRYCLRAICTTTKSDSVNNNATITSKPQVKQTEVEQVPINRSMNTNYTKGNKTDTMINKLTIIESDDKNSIRSNNLKDTEKNSENNKAISIIVKQEKGEAEISPRQLNQLVLNDKLLNQNQKSKVNQEKTNLICVLMEKTENIENIETNLITEQNITKYPDIKISDYNNQQSKIFTEQNRMTITKSSQSKNMTNLKIMQEDSTKLNNTIDVTDQNTKTELECNLNEHSLPQQLSQNSFNKNQNKNRSFGKISELISDEQKRTIESYYTVDMSIVNSEEVQKNITIINKKNIRCNICGTFYLRMDKCQVHIWGHLQMKPYQCKACDFATVTVSNVRCHIRKSHLKIKPFACHLCEKRYVTAILLEEHINTHTGARPYKCKLCDFASSSRQILSYHNATHKPLKDINCKICGKEFYSRSRLRAHMIVHNKDKAVMCKLCSAYLSNAEALKTHYKNIHMQDYVCNICGKHVKSRKALHNHQNVHAAARFKCTLCPNVYKTSQILKEHLLKHEGIRKYKCNICEKSFGQQSHLAAHMAVHSNIRFHCPGCDKPFNRQDNMKIHTKRCKPFLANPNLKNLLNKRERTISFNNITELTAELKNGNVTNSISQVPLKNENDKTLVKTVEEKQKTVINLCKLGLNISCIKPTNNKMTSDHVTNSFEKNVIKITDNNDKLISENEKLLVFENILGPESY